MGAHNLHIKDMQSRESGTLTLSSGNDGDTLTTDQLLANRRIVMSGGTNIAVTLPDPVNNGIEGVTVSFEAVGAGAMTVECSRDWGGLGSSTTLTVGQGAAAIVIANSANYTAIGGAIT
jgi:hypothetical protein